MKDRTLLLSALIACCIHALLLFLNLGMTRPSLASAVASIEVTLVASPESASAATSEPAPFEEPAMKTEPQPKEEPEPATKPKLEPSFIPEPEPVTEVEVPEAPSDMKVVEQPEVPTEPAAGEFSEEVSVSLVTGDISPDAGDGFEAPSADAEPQPSEQAEYFTGTIDRPPAYVYNPIPTYPRAARRLSQQGTALLLVEVLPNGHAGKISIERSSGHKLLDDAATTAVRKWRFEPARRGPTRVRAWVRIPVEFSLKD